MPHRLPPVLSKIDLPTAELWAARLDGELFQLGDCFMPIDEVEQPAHRARAVHSLMPVSTGYDSRLIAEQCSAAWIWGALDVAPIRHQLCVELNLRTGRDPNRNVAVREVVIDAHEITTVAGFRVTTALRTIIDLARFREPFDARDERTVMRLMRAFGITFDACVTEMDGRRNLPAKHRARERLSRC